MKTKLESYSPHRVEEISPKRTKLENDVHSPELPSLETLCVEDILTRNIFPFVGKNQFRFIGTVNKRFRTAYTTLFSMTTTYDQVATVEQARLCYNDIEKISLQPQIFC
jgi:hypothetical protein